MDNYPFTIDDVTKIMENGKGKLFMDPISGVPKNIIDAEEVLIKVRGDEQDSTSLFAKSFSIELRMWTVFNTIIRKQRV